MENQSQNKCELDIDMTGTLGTQVLKFATVLANCNNFTLRDLVKNNDNGKYEAKYYLPIGTTKFKYKETDMEIIYTRYENNIVGTAHYAEFPTSLKIICYNLKEILTQFLIDAREHSQPEKENKIICKILKNGYWSFLTKLPKRDKSSVFLPKKDKENILNDVTNFKNKKNIYHKYGIPYKRNYLLEGIPGCGKTTLILTVASELDMDIAIVNFGPNITDSVFMNAISNLPKNYILVLEDIDSLFINRQSTRENKSCVSFSGVLNTLDGLARNSGLITFMTTNYISKLDKALVRPGRIDLKLHFDFATECQIKKMYEFFFPNKLNDFKKFYKHIKKYKTTTSVLQKYFFDNLESDDILKNIKTFIDLSEDYNKDEFYKNMYC